MLSWRDVLDQESRREDLHRQADMWRLAQAANPPGPKATGGLARSIIRFGAWMERTGCRLQARFADIETSAILAGSGGETQLHGCS